MRFVFHALFALLLLGSALGSPAAAQDRQANSRSSGTGPRRTSSAAIDSLLAHYRLLYRLPAIAAVVVRADTTLGAAATGVRRQGAPDAVQLTDRFHIGSNGKAMTATVIARLVEEGRLAWSTRPIDVFPELRSSIHDAYRDVTLQQLLGHRAGLPPYTTKGPIRDSEQRRVPAASPHDQRRAFGVRLLQQPPHVAPGTFAYSNAGYALAAAMAEAAADEPWESLIQSRLARPLGIHLSRSQPARTDAAQPWGHRRRYALGFIPMGQYAPDPEDSWDIGSLFVSAGDLALSAGDYAIFLQEHLRGLQGRDGLLQASTVRYLHYGPEDYALGWGRSTFDGMAAHTHMGSEGTFIASVILLPEHDLAAAVLINSATPAAVCAAVEAVKALVRMHTPAAAGSPP